MHWKSDWTYLGCMSDEDYFNGSTYARAKKPAYVKTLLEQDNAGAASICDQYCNAIIDWVAGNIDEFQMFKLISSRRVL